jgi:hypothetical protein
MLASFSSEMPSCDCVNSCSAFILFNVILYTFSHMLFKEANRFDDARERDREQPRNNTVRSFNV